MAFYGIPCALAYSSSRLAFSRLATALRNSAADSPAPLRPPAPIASSSSRAMESAARIRSMGTGTPWASTASPSAGLVYGLGFHGYFERGNCLSVPPAATHSLVSLSASTYSGTSLRTHQS